MIDTRMELLDKLIKYISDFDWIVVILYRSNIKRVESSSKYIELTSTYIYGFRLYKSMIS